MSGIQFMLKSSVINTNSFIFRNDNNDDEILLAPRNFISLLILITETIVSINDLLF